MVIKKTIEEPLEEIDSVEQDTEPSFGIEPVETVEQIQAPKPKKVLNENQRKAVAANLKKGREALAKKQEQQRLDREARKEELLNVKQETIL